MAASEAGRVDVVRLLLERGVDARIKNKVIMVDAISPNISMW